MIISSTGVPKGEPVSSRLKEIGGLIGKLTVREMGVLADIVNSRNAIDRSKENTWDMLLRTSDELLARPFAQRDTKEVLTR